MRRRIARRTAALALAAVTLSGSPLTPPTAALAATRGAPEPCLSNGTGPICQVWYARVTGVSDGDTLSVDLDGVITRVRLTGIQAMEQTVYSSRPAARRGECHSLAATARLEELVAGSEHLGTAKTVRLMAQHEASHSGTRARRAVAVKVGTAWVDVGEVLLREGHALWLANPQEYAHNLSYHQIGGRAARAGHGLWNTSACGIGPAQDVPLKVVVSPDAPGSDTTNLNGEWIRVINQSASQRLDLSGWWVRDSMLRRYTFPAGTTVGPRAALTVHIGSGTNSPAAHYWGLTSPALDNPTAAPTHMGDGGYLFDPEGDLRAWQVYPCVENCPPPPAAVPAPPKVDLQAAPRGLREKVTIRNLTTKPVSLTGASLVSGPDRLRFRTRTVIPAKKVLTVYTKRGRSTALVRYWGKPRPILANGGDVVRLRSRTGAEMDCVAWGTRRC